MLGLQAPRKLATPVSFPVDALLDMRPFLSSSVLAQRCGLRLQEAEQDSVEGMAEEGDAPTAAQYSAYAVVCHHGNMQGGHYTAYIRCVAGCSMSGSGLALRSEAVITCQQHSYTVGHSSTWLGAMATVAWPIMCNAPMHPAYACWHQVNDFIK